MTQPLVDTFGVPLVEALDAAVARLERLRLAALEDRFDAEVGLGQAGELIAEARHLLLELRPVAARNHRHQHCLGQPGEGRGEPLALG